MTETRPGLAEIFQVFFKIGATAFGGVYSMLTYFQREAVEKRGWLTMEEFTEGVAIGQSTPGPPIINTGIFIGYRLRGLPGAAAATAGQVIPGFLLIIVLSYVYIKFHDAAAFRSVLRGVGAAVVGLLASVVYKMGLTVMKSLGPALLGLAGFCLLYFLKVNPIILISAGGLAGYMLYGRRA